MRVGSLFSGVGLGDLGLYLAGMEIVFQIEKDAACRKVLELRFPDVPKWSDIRDVNPTDLHAVDVIAGGFPCQPFSCAGKRGGAADDRYLWPEMSRLIQALKPRWVLGENVPGIVNLGLDAVLTDLEALGYEAWTLRIPACAVDAPHRRDRIWIIAHADRADLRDEPGRGESGRTGAAELGHDGEKESLADANRRDGRPGGPGRSEHGGRRSRYCGCPYRAPHSYSERLEKWKRKHPTLGPCPPAPGSVGWPVEPAICRVAHGVPGRVDRLKGLGNGQVVPLVEAIGRMMLEVDRC